MNRNMKKMSLLKIQYLFVIALLQLATGQLTGILVINFSLEKIKTDENHIWEFVRVSPEDSVTIPLETDLWLWHDKANLYALWEAKIDDTFTPGKYANRDESVNCDFLRLQLITGAENDFAYYYYAFPLGNKYDGIRKSDMNMEGVWNSKYHYTNTITDSLWTCLMKIPLDDMRITGKPPYNWKLIVTRYFSKQDEYYSVPFGTIRMGLDYFRTASSIVINDDLMSNRNLKLTAYVVGKYDFKENEYDIDIDNAGFDFSCNLGFSTKVKLSVNPDFSDVPMDSETDNYNLRYRPTYKENRFFFSEDMDIFDIDQGLFYTRNIIQPLFAAKLTGSTDKLSYGFLSTKDRSHQYINDTFSNDDLYNIISAKARFAKNSIQLAVLSRMNNNYHNEVLLIKPVLYFYKNNFVWVQQYASTRTQDDETSGGILSCGGAEFNVHDLKINTQLNICSQNFAADMGQIDLTDFKEIKSSAILSREISTPLIKSYEATIQYNNISDSSNTLIQKYFGGSFQATLPSIIIISMNHYAGQEIFNSVYHQWDKSLVSLSIYQTNWLQTTMSYSLNNTLVYNLNDVYKEDILSLSIRGYLSNYFSYSISGDKIRFFLFPANSGLDSEYLIINSDMKINLSNSISLSNGLRYNNYQSNGVSAYAGFFSNLSYEFKKDSFLYIGYSTVQHDINGAFFPHDKYVYMKASITF